MKLCSNQYDELESVWKCSECGSKSRSPSVRQCPYETVEEIIHWAVCPHRGPVLATITGREAGCGCGSTAVEVYRCGRFGEPVVKQAAGRCEDKVREAAQGYTGRTCRACDLPTVNWKATFTKPDAVFSPVHSLAAVTCYFNPQHSRTRKSNWSAFSEHMRDLNIPLYTVEGVQPGGDRDLPADENVMAICCRDVLWHKERLLNIGIESLPLDVEAIAWLDADLIFERRDIRSAILDGLTRWPVLQPWSECVLLDAAGRSQGWLGDRSAKSLASVNNGQPGDAHPHKKHPGFAWAARRGILSAIGGLYDRHITGGGDTAMAMGFYGDTKSLFLNQDRMSDAMLSHWLQWADRAAEVVQGQVGYLDGMIRHLYHGELVDRQYLHRWTKLAAAGFDPGTHVAVGDSGALEWTAEAPRKLREYVSDYLLRQRKEP